MLPVPGWFQPALVVVLILTLELLAANVFEPLLFGHSIGVPAGKALLIAAAFWAFLWGPVGLVLSCPLTVCLVVLGKYVPQLEFLAVLLADEPALDENFKYYQRLSAHDQDEAFDIVRQYAKDHSTDEVYDALLIPALTYAGYDLQREGLEEEDIQFISGVDARSHCKSWKKMRQEAPGQKGRCRAGNGRLTGAQQGAHFGGAGARCQRRTCPGNAASTAGRGAV